MNEDQSDEISDRDTMGGMVCAPPQAASELARCKTAGPVGSLGVVGGCLEVSSAEALCVEWKSWAAVWDKRCDAAQARKDYDDVRLSNARAEIYEECEKELRRLVERAKSRQPQDNKADYASGR